MFKVYSTIYCIILFSHFPLFLGWNYSEKNIYSLFNSPSISSMRNYLFLYFWYVFLGLIYLISLLSWEGGGWCFGMICTVTSKKTTSWWRGWLTRRIHHYVKCLSITYSRTEVFFCAQNANLVSEVLASLWDYYCPMLLLPTSKPSTSRGSIIHLIQFVYEVLYLFRFLNRNSLPCVELIPKYFQINQLSNSIDDYFNHPRVMIPMIHVARN